MVDFISLSASIVTVISPFMPYLKSLGKNVQKKLEDVIAEKGGNLVWKKAETLWSKLKNIFQDDPEIEGASTMLSAAPENKTYQEILTQSLAKKLESNPELAQELLKIMGGKAGVQEVIAGNEAWIEGIKQKMASSGTQKVQGGDRAVIQDVNQEMG
jgi:hypothetical protein